MNIDSINQIIDEIKKESNLTEEEKTEVIEILDNKSSNWKKTVADKLSKYGGRFTGHFTRAFLGLDE